MVSPSVAADLGVGPAARAVLEERYLRRDDEGRLVESPGDMMDRVARHVAGVEDAYLPGSSARWSEEFSGLLRRLEFLPNSPTLMNAGTGVGLLSGCFVLPLDDSLESIFATLGHAALVHQAGGGTGFSFARLRPEGDPVHTTGGRASGPVSFVRLFDAASQVVRMGGRRRAANMAVLDVSHPDIEAFIAAKADPDSLPTFNLSVGVTDEFMTAVSCGGDHYLVHPRTGRVTRRVPARAVFDRIAAEAWRGGDPGLVFLDEINRANPLPERIEATNPCGEVPLAPWESCNLGSVNLARLLTPDGIDEARLRAVVRMAVRFLDDVIDAARNPCAELDEAARATRKIGLGMMGLAEALAALGIPYDSDAAVALGARVASVIEDEARQASTDLANERGAFPRYAASSYPARGFPPLRNAQLTSVAPTGTISLLAGTTAGIEPMFAVAYRRELLGRSWLEVNPLFEQVARRDGCYSEALVATIARTGTIPATAGVPEEVRRAFVTALEIDPAWHIRMQAAIQRHVDAAVSKTVNVAAGTDPAGVAAVFVAAWRAGVKGITVYRDGSRPDQVLRLPTDDDPTVRALSGYAGGCAARACEF